MRGVFSFLVLFFIQYLLLSGHKDLFSLFKVVFSVFDFLVEVAFTSNASPIW